MLTRRMRLARSIHAISVITFSRKDIDQIINDLKILTRKLKLVKAGRLPPFELNLLLNRLDDHLHADGIFGKHTNSFDGAKLLVKQVIKTYPQVERSEGDEAVKALVGLIEMMENTKDQHYK